MWTEKGERRPLLLRVGARAAYTLAIAFRYRFVTVSIPLRYLFNHSSIQLGVDLIYYLLDLTSTEGGYVLLGCVCLSVRVSVRRITENFVNGF